MATAKEEGAVPDFLRMDAQSDSIPAKLDRKSDWYGWPSTDVKPVTLLDDLGRTVRIRTPVMDLEGLITPSPEPQTDPGRSRYRDVLPQGGCA